MVDKKCDTYYKDNQELIVESAFVGNISLNDILKTYLLERRQSQMEVASGKSECYNTTSMIAAGSKGGLLMSAQQTGHVYKAALYLRLSKDDEGAGESQSIKTQRDILEAYAKREGFVIVDEYVDDGYSGTNFDRPAFQRMLTDIEAGRINCVLSKDFSRLGRNSARGLDYIDEYFPAHDVRYISVTDGYDSLYLTNGISMAAPMMMFVKKCMRGTSATKSKVHFRLK